jgi:hypothetical protein
MTIAPDNQELDEIYMTELRNAVGELGWLENES